MKCECMVHSRMVQVAVVNEVPQMELRQLPHPEPCGESGALYEVHAAERQVKRGLKEKPPKAGILAKMTPWAIKASPFAVKQSFCDKHKKKAEREGKILAPVNEKDFATKGAE